VNCKLFRACIFSWFRHADTISLSQEQETLETDLAATAGRSEYAYVLEDNMCFLFIYLFACTTL
jgi:hypothetical protein